MTERDREDVDDDNHTHGFWQSLASMLAPGPFPWLMGAVPDEPHFRPGRHMHGLEEHDVTEPEPDRRPVRL
jgi:hypothetical protein